VFCHLYLLNDWYFLKISSVFDTIAAIVISFIAAAALVILVKDDLELTKNPLFWFCLAIFGYTFCTYFIVSFITNPIYREKLWWIHNVANISAYLLYAYGYWVSKQRNASK
jgi:magnesium-transporting ATPase (P-type)